MREDIMLRMILLGMLIPLSVGVLAAMELRTPPRRGAAVSEPGIETVAIPDSLGALAKTDRLNVAYASTDTPAPPPQVDDRISTSQTATSNAPKTLKPISRHPPVQKLTKVPAAALPKPRPTTPNIGRAAITERQKVGTDTIPCRLSAFGGLRKALDLSGCEI
jgi:hypothetical protein